MHGTEQPYLSVAARPEAGMVTAPATDSRQGRLSEKRDSALPASTTVQIADEHDKAMAPFVTSQQVQNITFSSAITTGTRYQIVGDSVGKLTESGWLGPGASVATVPTCDASAGRGGFRRSGGH